MKLNSEFFRLPLTFDVERLISEVKHFDKKDWVPHPSGFLGNTSIPLISVNGETNDDFLGKMQITPQLERCSYIKQVIASFDEVFGRSRLMRLAGGYEVPEHTDLNYHWYNRVRIHIPIITYPDVIFYCGDSKVNMQAGEAWIFDSWKMHKVKNNNDKTRTHLVIDTAGSRKFWEMVEHSDQPHKNIFNTSVKKKYLPYTQNKKCNITTEKYNASVVMSPGEVDALCLDIINDTLAERKTPNYAVKAFIKIINNFRYEWRRTWSIYGSNEEGGWPYYDKLINIAWNEVSTKGNIPLSSNKADAAQVFNARVLSSCLNSDVVQDAIAKPSKQVKRTTAIKQTSKNSLCPCGSKKKFKRCCGKN